MDKDEKLKRLLKERVSPCFKRWGFKKRGMVYQRDLLDYSWIVDVQRGRFDLDGKRSFILGWHIVVPLAFAIFCQKPQEPAKRGMGCAYDQLSALDGGLGWQQLTPDDPEDYELEVGDKLVVCIDEVLMPFLQRLKGLRDIADFICPEVPKYFHPKRQYMLPKRSTRLSHAAIIYHQLGDMARAREVMDKAVTLELDFYKAIKQPSDGLIESLKERLFPS